MSTAKHSALYRMPYGRFDPFKPVGRFPARSDTDLVASRLYRHVLLKIVSFSCVVLICVKSGPAVICERIPSYGSDCCFFPHEPHSSGDADMTRTRIAYMPIITYPEAIADETIRSAAAFVAPLECALG